MGRPGGHRDLDGQREVTGSVEGAARERRIAIARAGNEKPRFPSW